MTGYRRGGATPIWSPAQSGGYMYIQCIARGLTPGITRGVTRGVARGVTHEVTRGVAHW